MLPFPSLFTGYGFTICTANIDDGGRVIDPGPGGRGLDDTLGGVQSYQWGERLVDYGESATNFRASRRHRSPAGLACMLLVGL